ncbi:dihydropteroate synthase [Frankia sp. Ag45/Mut15]|uniref:Dihydropteroate synthase n=1 Tax=Frankia umida TaxID=573489 RepID=A0ABT0JSF6_9ACTN|nr:dihydropteroate synthase [Frankia umida]MCK9874444.1 dihydropteroate synthase [Frankia umida]
MNADVAGLFTPGELTRVMGVVNVTPDSFSDGGTFLDPIDAVRAGLRMVAEGADLIDVGGESTRPGALRVPASEEMRRVLPVVAQLAAAGVRVSVDTTRVSVAAAAVDAGAVLVNDVSGGHDPELLAMVADRGVHYVLMHARGPSATMAEQAVYGDVVAEVVAELDSRLEAVLAAGIAEEQVVIDPGIGFAKTSAHNWALLGHLHAFAAFGRPLLVGTSRKSFLGTVLADGQAQPRPSDARDDATQATTALLAAADVWGVRVHAVRPAADAVRVVRAWKRSAQATAPTTLVANPTTSAPGGSRTADASRTGWSP